MLSTVQLNNTNQHDNQWRTGKDVKRRPIWGSIYFYLEGPKERKWNTAVRITDLWVTTSKPVFHIRSKGSGGHWISASMQQCREKCRFKKKDADCTDIVWIFSLTHIFFLIIIPGYMFRPRGPSLRLLCCHETDPNFIYITFGIPIALQRIWHTVSMYN
jgi:hypothetical protein